jgi:hypothetical protein
MTIPLLLQREETPELPMEEICIHGSLLNATQKAKLISAAGAPDNGKEDMFIDYNAKRENYPDGGLIVGDGLGTTRTSFFSNSGGHRLGRS